MSNRIGAVELGETHRCESCSEDVVVLRIEGREVELTNRQLGSLVGSLQIMAALMEANQGDANAHHQ